MIFISHARRDLPTAIAVQDRLTEAGLPSWLDARAIPVGEGFVEAIGSSLREASDVLLIDSEFARQSYWVTRELACARRLAGERGLRVIAIPADSTLGARQHSHVDYSTTSLDEALFILEQGGLQRISAESNDSVTLNGPLFRLQPAVWLGFSLELAALDAWWFSDTPGLWVTGLGGTGKTSLVRTWLRAVQQIGYAQPLSLEVHSWSFYETPRVEPMEHHVRTHRTLVDNQCFLLDGFEDLSEPARNRALQLARSCSARFIITSREAPPEDYPNVREVVLSSMTADDAKLVLSRVTPQPEQAEMAKVIDYVAGNPLVLTLVAGQLRDGSLTVDRLVAEIEESNERFGRRG